MGYGGVWVITGMGYDRFDCSKLLLLTRVLHLNISSGQGGSFIALGCAPINITL
jgi:hypothetical protein